MTLLDLHKSIVDRDNKHLYILTGEEVYIRDEYIKNITNIFSRSPQIRCDSVSAALKQLQKPNFSNTCRVFIVSDDKTYLKEENAWKTVNNAVLGASDILIITYSTIDKRGKFYKQHKDIVCEFEKLSDDILIKYIKRDSNLSEQLVKKLIDVCSGNYGRIRLELDKISNYADVHNISHDDSFCSLLACGGVYQEIGDITFKFVDSILLHRLEDVQKYAIQAKLIKEPEILTLSVLYNGLRQIYQVQSVPKGTKDISKKLCLTPFQIKLAREKSGVYANENVLYMLNCVTKVEQGIKTGKISADVAIDYLLVNIL